MIFGIGTDLVKIKRFKSWIKDSKKIERFFNKKEIIQNCDDQYLLEHYASRFAAKEAFSKALGTGIRDFSLTDVYVTNNKDGKPEINLENNALMIYNQRCKESVIHLSLTHEKDYAQAFVIIENLEK